MRDRRRERFCSPEPPGEWAKPSERGRSRITPNDTDIAAILDGPPGLPLLEALLAEHDADTAWEPRPCHPAAAA